MKKTHPEVSPFVKHVAINNCHGNMVDIAMPSPCSASFHTRGIDNLTLAGNLKIYIEEAIMRLRTQSKPPPPHEENWGKIIIYEMILSLVNNIIKYFNNPTDDRLKIVDWYFIDLIINKDKIIVWGFFMSLVYFLMMKYLLREF